MSPEQRLDQRRSEADFYDPEAFRALQDHDAARAAIAKATGEDGEGKS